MGKLYVDFLKRDPTDISHFWLTICLWVLNWSNSLLYLELLQELLEIFIYELVTIVIEEELLQELFEIFIYELMTIVIEEGHDDKWCSSWRIFVLAEPLYFLKVWPLSI